MGAMLLICAALVHDTQLGPGNHTVRLGVDGWLRSYQVHIPKTYDPAKPMPVVLVFHGAMMNSVTMALATGLNRKADDAGFIAVYPNGTGAGEWLLVFNAGGVAENVADKLPDDVKFTEKLLDDLEKRFNVDPKRIYVTGLSNGGMMCYRLAESLSDRIAAIAPVAGTMTCEAPHPKRPVPIIHFHGTVDTFVPDTGPDTRARVVKFKSLEDTMTGWAAANHCLLPPVEEQLPDRFDDGTTVTRKEYRAGKDGAEIVLYTIVGGGHTWPGRDSILGGILGRTTQEISANDLMWEFFEKHPLP